ncbi:PEP-CTERM sorting domain-containing protein [Coleofasciculus sp. F4-SAH-05]|uniref:PEP-CTERM sorting domain-containing protein n=1 Tax=Coleofasciculus sp. F4-SAH-05 TaxID=3069525 RepID=UPI004064362E
MPLPPLPPLPVPPSFDGKTCTNTDLLAAIIYCGFEEVEFFAVDDDDNFLTDGDGNKILVATLHSETHIVHTPVPEPATILGSTLALGLGAFFKRKKQQKD